MAPRRLSVALAPAVDWRLRVAMSCRAPLQYGQNRESFHDERKRLRLLRHLAVATGACTPQLFDPRVVAINSRIME